MKATGIVRRVDDLGRIVIPKEIRRTLRIREGDPLEIYTEKDGGVIFRKYSPMGDLQDLAAQMCDAIGSNTGRIAAVSDRDGIIALAGAPKRELMDKPNTEELSRLMEQRKHYRYENGPKIQAAEGSDKYHLGVASPILFGINFQGIAFPNFEGSSDFFGNYNTPEVINTAYNTCGFHSISFSFLITFL